MNAKSIRTALRRERLLVCTYEPAGTVYSLDNGVPVSKIWPLTSSIRRGCKGTSFCGRTRTDCSPAYADVACGRMTRALTWYLTRKFPLASGQRPVRS
jgi:hypothetical protein